MGTKALERALATLAAIASSPKPRALFADRNLHQLIMCAVFGACKLEGGKEVTFIRIIDEHKRLFKVTDGQK
ncbi:hypothetical protein T484DRAFT_1793030, partial [Baffinella frigidus]